MRRTARITFVVVACLVVGLASTITATAHEERESFFPDQGASVPQHRSIQQATQVVIVCKEDSGDRIAEIADADIRGFNEDLWERCRTQFDGGGDTHTTGDHEDVFQHLQAAVDHIRETGPDGGGVNVYVLPGLYLEEPSRDEACNADYDGGVVAYEDGYNCPTITQLVGIFGDDPADEDRVCDNALCNLQVEGTGDDPEDVIFEGGFEDDGEWIERHNGIRADRADGFYIRNLTTQLVRENGIYVHETDGYVIDGTVTRAIELYGILTFASDHGVIKDCEAYYNGDSGVYPGSSADVNADNDQTERLDRWAVEVFGCDSHHNALGFSGTAGNSVNFHDNDFHHNGAGYVTDSFVGGHPGMPQDHAWLWNNRIYSNNVNYYEQYVHTGECDKPPREWRILETGTVCPVFPIPVGTGIMIAGGNHDLVEDNLIYDNWRQGAMLFFVPTILRESPEEPGDLPGVIEQDQYETSHFNHFVNNTLGETPDGLTQPNGIDFWWDDEGEGNCWQGNTSTATEDGTPTSNSPHQGSSFPDLPDCDSGGSTFSPSDPVKSAGLAPCASYDREDNPDPEGCDWFDSPTEPAGREDGGPQPAPDPGADDGGGAPAGGDSGSSGPSTPATGGGLVLGLLGAAAIAGAAALRRHRAVATRAGAAS